MANPANAYLGQVLDGRYRLDAHLGTGNFSYVFQAFDLQSGSEVALKMLLPSAATSVEAVIEFDTEARLLRILGACANVTNLTDSGRSNLTVEINGVPTSIAVLFHVMELADGALNDLLPRRHELPWTEKMRLFRDVVAGTHQMHTKMIAHRDLKSSNVLLFDDAAAPRVVARVADLGRSCDLAQAPRFPTDSYFTGRGDLAFAPPEYLWGVGETSGTALRRADIYLLGSVLFELATAQGMTGAALPHGWDDLHGLSTMTETERAAAFPAAVRSMRRHYDTALGLMADELPPVIRHYGVQLVRQLCNPDPTRREHRYRAERKNPTWGLQWLIRRVDIMTKNLERSEALEPTRRTVRQR